MNSKFFAFLVPLFILISLPESSRAGEYLVNIPGITEGNLSLNGYINALYMMSISIAALLAVIKIIIAGVKWMLTDIVPSKQDAKKDIEGALLGLLIIMAAVLILTTINPALTSTNVLQSIEPIAEGPQRATSTPRTLQEVNRILLGEYQNRVQTVNGRTVILSEVSWPVGQNLTDEVEKQKLREEIDKIRAVLTPVCRRQGGVGPVALPPVEVPLPPPATDTVMRYQLGCSANIPL